MLMEGKAKELWDNQDRFQILVLCGLKKKQEISPVISPSISTWRLWVIPTIPDTCNAVRFGKETSMVPTVVVLLSRETDNEFSMIGDRDLGDFHSTDTWWLFHLFEPYRHWVWPWSMGISSEAPLEQQGRNFHTFFKLMLNCMEMDVNSVIFLYNSVKLLPG